MPSSSEQKESLRSLWELAFQWLENDTNRWMPRGDNKCPEENKGRMNRMGGDGVGDSLPMRRLGKASSVR